MLDWMCSNVLVVPSPVVGREGRAGNDLRFAVTGRELLFREEICVLISWGRALRAVLRSSMSGGKFILQ